MEVLFWVSLLGAIYSYVLYPAILWIMPRREQASAEKRDDWPALALIVTVYNEEGRLGDKLANCLQIEYPEDKLDIVVASDASDDGTDLLAQTYSPSRIRLTRTATRGGKENAQLQAIRSTDAPILVFSDVATRLDPDALKYLAAEFSDPTVGAVSSEDRFVSESDEPVGEGVYVRYEMWLRRLESSVNSLVGLSGSFFAARRVVCRDWDIASPSDFNTALNAVRNGYRAVSSPRVLGYYRNIRDERAEYRRKFRTVIRGISAVARHPDILNPFRFGLFSFEITSHKLMRWMVPWFLAGLLPSSTYLSLTSAELSYQTVLVSQLVFYSLALAGAASSRLKRSHAVRIPHDFVQANLATAHACIAFIFGKRAVVWQPSVR